MAQFKAEDGTTINLDTKKRTVIVNGKSFKRVPRPKTPSRATRLAETVKLINEQLGEAQSYKDKLEDPGSLTLDEIEELTSGFASVVENLEYSELESLKDEMESWRDGMEGTNLESTEKFERVSEAAEALESACSRFESLDFDCDGRDQTVDEIVEAMEEAINEIEEAVSELESVEFPGMFG